MYLFWFILFSEKVDNSWSLSSNCSTYHFNYICYKLENFKAGTRASNLKKGCMIWQWSHNPSILHIKNNQFIIYWLLKFNSFFTDFHQINCRVKTNLLGLRDFWVNPFIPLWNMKRKINKDDNIHKSEALKR